MLIIVTCSKTATSQENIPFYIFKEQPPSDKSSFVLMKDGSRIDGTKVDGSSGLLVKDAVKIDGRSIPADQVEGFQSKGIYYKRTNNNYAKRLIQGKINVYQKIGPSPRSGMEKLILFQKGDNGILEEFTSVEQLKALASDCPKAYEMMNKNEKDLKKALKKDHYYYFQNVILTYNSCS
jgi:hypothetical protein